MAERKASRLLTAVVLADDANRGLFDPAAGFGQEPTLTGAASSGRIRLLAGETSAYAPKPRLKSTGNYRDNK